MSGFLTYLLLAQGWLASLPQTHRCLASRRVAARWRAVYAISQPDDVVYATLGVAPGSDDLDLIRSSFRKRAKDLHPDVNSEPGAAEDFLKLVRAFETLISFLASPRTGTETSGAADAWGEGATSARSRPAGSRNDAEAATPEATDRRRARWRQVSFEEIWREQMPFGFVADEARRGAFLDAMEATVRSFTGGARATGVEYDSKEQKTSSEEARLRACSNREVLTAELEDLQLSLQLTRQRMRSLEHQAERAEAKAAMWRGASPASEADRVQAMQRELDYLELAHQLRGRLAAQRLSAQRADQLAKMVRR
eukprot:CAMPEP_0119077316 /NCGR_PEP_ID=MMETSP1178-20130426/94384_1 /TAXON_ID=33656 /ORGANISM="unid sp, Strain CCMP2000" /LENGTH=309 /DNA_ID=CAMNT_0007059667 /DNA_START=42 /DNA_END=967 /DNA_ORIENTATION=+